MEFVVSKRSLEEFLKQIKDYPKKASKKRDKKLLEELRDNLQRLERAKVRRINCRFYV